MCVSERRYLLTHSLFSTFHSLLPVFVSHFLFSSSSFGPKYVIDYRFEALLISLRSLYIFNPLSLNVVRILYICVFGLRSRPCSLCMPLLLSHAHIEMCVLWCEIIIIATDNNRLCQRNWFLSLGNWLLLLLLF